MKRTRLPYIPAILILVLLALNIYFSIGVTPEVTPPAGAQFALQPTETAEPDEVYDSYIEPDRQYSPPPIVISQAAKKIYVNDSYRLRVLSGGDVRWESSDPSVVSVNEEGVATALKSGEAVITATDGAGNSDSCTVKAQKVVYLTVDDNPTNSMTWRLIRLFNEYDIKVTLFFCAQPGDKPWYQEFYAAGHTLAMHGYSHAEGKIYSSDNAFIENIEAERRFLLGCTDAEYIQNLIRFPTGSGGYKDLRRKVLDMGYRVFDWSALFQDSYYTEANSCYEAVMSGIDADCEVVLMHHKMASYEALPRFIDEMRERGYEFAPITEETTMWYF